MRNTEIIKRENLLNEDGTLKNPGWSRSLIQTYDRNQIKAPKHRIKEWDYYLVTNDDFGICLTVADLAYAGMQSVSFIDFKKPSETTKTNINKPLVMGKLNMPSSSVEGDISFSNEDSTIHIKVSKNKRRIFCFVNNFIDDIPFKCDITLHEPDMDSIVIATPWKENPLAFYYNQKINCMSAEGSVTIGEKSYEFKKEDSFGTLDWGRGVWTYDNTWFWGSGNGYVNGKPFGFNIGHGFGDTKAATENIIFYDGVGHKLDDLNIYYDESDFLKPWLVTSDDKRFNMEFKPIINRSAKINALVILTDQNQVFGKMSGTAVLDDGTQLEIKDMLCFIEKVHNRY